MHSNVIMKLKYRKINYYGKDKTFYQRGEREREKKLYVEYFFFEIDSQYSNKNLSFQNDPSSDTSLKMFLISKLELQRLKK